VSTVRVAAAPEVRDLDGRRSDWARVVCRSWSPRGGCPSVTTNVDQLGGYSRPGLTTTRGVGSVRRAPSMVRTLVLPQLAGPRP